MRRNTRRSVSISRPLRRNRKRPNYSLLLCVFMMAAAVSGAAAFAVRAPMLAVKEVQISGVKMSDRAAVESASNDLLGQNILTLRKSEVVDKIRHLSEVREVKMGRDLPCRVWVRVWERRPDAVLSDGQSCCLVENDGFMFHRIDGPRRDLPLLVVDRCDKLQTGKVAASPDVRNALEVLSCARKEGISLNKISVDPQGDICLNMGSDFYVRLGQPDDIAKKMALLRSALVYKPSIAKEAEYIDISCPEAPVMKPRASSQSAS